MVAPPWYELPPRGYGGLEMICSALIDGLVDRGHEVTLFGAGTRTATKATFVSTSKELQYPRLGETMPDVLHAARVNRLIAAGDFDVIHDHTTPGALAGGRVATPTVVTVHGAVDGEFGDYYEAIGDAVRLIAISHSQRAVRPELPWIATVHNGIKIVDGPIPERRTDGPVLWLARFNPDKGPDLAIQACHEAGVPLVLAGKCNEPLEERYLEKVLQPMIDDGVQLVVNGDRQTILRHVREARCLIMPIRWKEPFGMVMIEAMAEGVPVVALRRGAVPEVILDGVTGFICDRPAELPKALLRAPELDPAACVRHVRAHFSAEIMAARYERVYHQAIAEHYTSLVSMPVSDAGGLASAADGLAVDGLTTEGLAAAGGAGAGVALS